VINIKIKKFEHYVYYDFELVLVSLSSACFYNNALIYFNFFIIKKKPLSTKYLNF